MLQTERRRKKLFIECNEEKVLEKEVVDRLSELLPARSIASGFVRIFRFYQQKKKDALYQLSDYYTAFYFHFLKDR